MVGTNLMFYGFLTTNAKLGRKHANKKTAKLWSDFNRIIELSIVF